MHSWKAEKFLFVLHDYKLIMFQTNFNFVLFKIHITVFCQYLKCLSLPIFKMFKLNSDAKVLCHVNKPIMHIITKIFTHNLNKVENSFIES